MLKTLLKKQMAEIFRNYFYDPKKNKMRSKGATIAYIALYALLMVGLLGGMFALMAVGLCGPLVEAGMDWLYYLLIGLIAVLLGTFGSVFSTYSSLYLSKDNDLLLSMPIPVRCVMASRLLGVYLLGLMYAAVVIVPGVIVYWITAPVNGGGDRRRCADGAARVRDRDGALVPARLGGRAHQPEAEKQELHHRDFVAAVSGGVLLRVLQGAGAHHAAGGKRRPCTA